MSTLGSEPFIWFPELRSDCDYEETSGIDDRYNCIAWAACETNQKWWPVHYPTVGVYWPPNAPVKETVDAFERAFASVGYRRCWSKKHQRHFERICIFADGLEVKHAARQLRSGVWTSKLGEHIDISHQLESVAGNNYGAPASVMKRPTRDCPRWRSLVWKIARF